MLPLDHPDRIQITFDDHRLVAHAGLILPTTLARHLGLSQLVDRRLDLGNAPGRANTGDKLMTLVASALAGGDCIDDADVCNCSDLRGSAAVFACSVRSLQHKLSVADRLRPLKREQLPTCCALGEPSALWAARSRRDPPWASFCAASGGAMFASWIG